MLLVVAVHRLVLGDVVDADGKGAVLHDTLTLGGHDGPLKLGDLLGA